MALYILWGLALVQGLLSLRDGWRNRNYALGWVAPRGKTTETVCVFCPVKGVDAGFGDCVNSLLHQEHADYRVVFVVESETDPAFEYLSPLRSGRVGIHVAGPATDCGQKVHNLASAVRESGSEIETLVFCDADAVYPPTWLQDLIGPLGSSDVGATTGYRWYVADSGAQAVSVPTWLRSAWNASIAGFLGPHPNNFAWGGSTAIRREIFEQSHVLDFWHGALSDDYALTEAVRRRGLSVRYVPTCLVPSYGTCSWSELFEFTTRQIKITRVYAPRVWRMAFASYALFNVAFLTLMIRMIHSRAAAVLLATLIALAAVRSAMRLPPVRKAIRSDSLDRLAWFYVLIPPVVAWLYQWNLLASALNRRIEWKGVGYTMEGPNRTLVERAGTG